MPANLSQQYRNAEKKYRRANTVEEELECLLLMLREIPKHKGTDKLQGELKRKISQTKDRIQNQSAKKSTAGFRLPRQGSGRVVVVGGPNSGKSQLFNKLTDSEAEVAEFPFTTSAPQPALMTHEDVKIQVVDTPPVAAGNFDPNIEALIRGADLVLLLLSLNDDEGLDYYGAPTCSSEGFLMMGLFYDGAYSRLFLWRHVFSLLSNSHVHDEFCLYAVSSSTCIQTSVPLKRVTTKVVTVTSLLTTRFALWSLYA